MAARAFRPRGSLVVVYLPAPLRRFTDGQGRVHAAGDTVADVLADLERRFPELRERLLDEAGQIRQFIGVFVDGENARLAGGLERPLGADVEIAIVAATSGGR